MSSCLVGKTALHWAAAVNNVDGIRLLLQSNANKDVQDHRVMVYHVCNICESHAFLLGAKSVVFSSSRGSH